jgi:hypothetical protein
VSASLTLFIYLVYVLVFLNPKARRVAVNITKLPQLLENSAIFFSIDLRQRQVAKIACQHCA